MSNTADEQPKAAIAKKVISGNQKYFVPDQGKEVEAETVEEAVAAAQDDSDNTKDQKVGDGK